MSVFRGNVLTTGQVASGTAATVIVANNPQRVTILVANGGTNAFLGNATVTATTGILIAANTVMEFRDYTGPLSVFPGATSGTISWVEWGQ